MIIRLRAADWWLFFRLTTLVIISNYLPTYILLSFITDHPIDNRKPFPNGIAIFLKQGLKGCSKYCEGNVKPFIKVNLIK